MNKAEALAKATRDMEIAKHIYNNTMQTYNKALSEYDEEVKAEVIDD